MAEETRKRQMKNERKGKEMNERKITLDRERKK